MLSTESHNFRLRGPQGGLHRWCGAVTRHGGYEYE